MSGWKERLQGPAIVAFALAVGLPAIAGGLIRDDHLYITRNPHVTESVGVGTLLSSPLWPYEDVGLYRPLTTASFRLDFVLGETLTAPITAERAIIPHVHNLVLNGIGAVLLGMMLLRFGLPRPVALLGAALFAVHPARSEAFLWISGRAECLMTVFVLGALVIVMGGASWRRLSAAGVCAACAFLAKEQGATLLVLAPLVPGLARKERLRVLGVMAVAILPWLAVRYDVLGTLGPTGVQRTMLGTGIGGMFVHAMGWCGRYALLLLWPMPLLHEYDEPAGTDWLGLGVTGCVVLAAVFAGRRGGATGFAFALFVLSLLPVLNLVHRSSEPFAERFLALPAAGAIAWMAVVFPWERAPRPALLKYAALGLLLAATARTVTRAFDYADQETLFEAQMNVAPEEAASWGLRGQIATLSGEWGAANKSFGLAVGLFPDGYKWRIEHARALIARPGADPEEAVGELTEIVERWPMIGPAWSLLGGVEAARGNGVAAERAFRRAVEEEPRDWRARWELAKVILRARRTAEAQAVVTELVASLDEAARQRPWDFQQLAAAGRVLLESGQPKAAGMRLRDARRRALRAEDKAKIDELLLRVGR